MTVACPHPLAPPPAAFVHVALPGDQRWGCAVAGRGRGIVVATVQFGTATIGFDVQFEDGSSTRAWRSEVRRAFAVVHA